VGRERLDAELTWLLQQAKAHRGGLVPQWALEAAAYRLGYSPAHLRDLLREQVGVRRLVWQVEPWLLPLWYAHGNLRALHDDLVAARTELARVGAVVPEELAAVPASYVTFWRAFQRLPQRFEAFTKRGSNGARAKMVSLRWAAARRNEVWQADCCKLDIWVLPRRASVPVRPWLIVYIDDATRLVVAATMCLAQPSAEETAATCARALRFKSSPDGAVVYGGRPSRILWDHGSEFRAELLTVLAVSAGFAGTPVLRYTPTHKGKVEAFFGTFQRWILMSLPGYSKGPKLTDGSGPFLGDPSELLSDEQLWAHIAARIEHYNWARPHSSLGRRTPGEVWAGDATPLVEVDDEALRVAVLRSRRRHVAHPDGVALRTTKYLSVDPVYDDWIGERLEVGYLPHDGSFIELFTPAGDWLCSAYEQSSFTPEELYKIISRRRGHLDQIEAAALEAKALRIQRASAIRRGHGEAPGLVATALARRTGRVTDRDAPPPLPTLVPDSEWLAASRAALHRRDAQ
jgi:putative transposase